MAEHAHTTTGRPLSPPDIVDLSAHPDGALLRVCAALERLRTITDEMEQIAAGIPARTAFGRRMKELAL